MSTPKTKQRDPFVAAALGWLVPGLGQLYVGQVRRFVLDLALVGGTFFVGLGLGGFRNVYWSSDRKFHFVAQVGAGGPTLMGSGLRWILVRQSPGQPTDAEIFESRNWSRLEHYGTLYTCVAGLLNLMVLVNAAVMAHTGGRGLPPRDED